MLDDAVQDVFLVAHRRWSEFSGRSSRRTWVYGIMLRVAQDYRRSMRRHRARIRAIRGGRRGRNRASCPAEEAARHEATRRLHQILDELDEEQRAAFVLVELEELTIRRARRRRGSA